ncbi:Beta-hexosaminidase [Arachis hypogaea]|nr:Beta-hexosaminidase [Arachis hypogaea]
MFSTHLLSFGYGFIFKIFSFKTHACYNVLHWHIIHKQSFPLEVASFPNM